MLELVQKSIKHALPIICVDRKFWQPLYDFLQNCVKNNYISQKDLELFKIVDNAEEAYQFFKENRNR